MTNHRILTRLCALGIVSAVLTYGCTTVPVTPGSQTQGRQLKAGDTYKLQILTGNGTGTPKVALDRQMQVVDLGTLEPTATKPAQPLLVAFHTRSDRFPVMSGDPDNQHFANPDTHEINAHDLSVDQLKTLLTDHWDAHIGGKDDPGLNTAEFHAFLGRCDISLNKWVELFNESGMTMPAYAEFCQQVIDSQGSMQALVVFLGHWNAKLSDFTGATGTGSTPAQVVAALKAGKLTFVDLSVAMMRASDGKTAPSPALLRTTLPKAADQLKTSGGFQTKQVAGALLTGANLVLNLLKGDSAPYEGTRAIMLADDPDPVNYLNAQKLVGDPHLTFKEVDETFGPIGGAVTNVQYTTRFDATSQCGATNRTQGGYWSPTIFVTSKEETLMVGWSAAMTGTFQLPWAMDNDNPRNAYMRTNLHVSMQTKCAGIHSGDLDGWMRVSTKGIWAPVGATSTMAYEECFQSGSKF